MNTKLLRQKILDLAIRGKLVPQDPNDEPASVLLEKIKAEKDRLIKEKKIKHSKKKSVDKSHYGKKVPFDIPESWEWCRLGFLCDYGKSEKSNPTQINDNAWILDLEDIEKDTGRLINRTLKSDRDTTSIRNVFKKGDVLYSKLRTYLNKVIVADRQGYCTTEILPLDFNGFVVPEFARFVLMSNFFLEYTAECCYGVKMPRLGTHDGTNAPFPLPPINEQQQIVNVIAKLFNAIEEIDTSKESLEQYIIQTKSKVLELAIKGKLVPQNNNDEPASFLLDRIKNNKNSKLTTTDKSHYAHNVPDSWIACNLYEVCDFERGVTFPASAKYTFKRENHIACIRTANVQEKLEVDDLWYIDRSFLKNNHNKLLRHNDIIISSANSKELVGKTSFVEDIREEMCFGGFVMVIRTNIINSKFLFYYLRNCFNYGVFSKNASQTTNIANINATILGNLIIQVPPIAEQQRIVEKVEEIFKVLDFIQANLRTNN